MATMEHFCSDDGCDFDTFNNYPNSPKLCPKCGSKLKHIFDEDPDEYFEFEMPDAYPSKFYP